MINISIEGNEEIILRKLQKWYKERYGEEASEGEIIKHSLNAMITEFRLFRNNDRTMTLAHQCRHLKGR